MENKIIASDELSKNFLQNFQPNKENVEKLWQLFQRSELTFKIGKYEYTESLESIKYEVDEGDEVEINSSYSLVFKESYGGEGMGDSFYFVFSIFDRKENRDVSFWQWDGYYASYEGGNLDDLFEVTAKEITKTIYEKIQS